MVGREESGSSSPGVPFGNLPRVATPSLKDLLALDVETRVALVQELWDSIVKDAEGGAELALSDADRLELDERLREDEARPQEAIPWDEARVRLRNGR